MTTQPAARESGASQHVAAEIRAELARQQLSIRQLSTKMGVHHLWANRRISTMQTDLSPEDIEMDRGSARRAGVETSSADVAPPVGLEPTTAR